MDDTDAGVKHHDEWGDDAADAALRADVRRLGVLLGESLVRQVGPELLATVEDVRRLTRTDPAAAAVAWERTAAFLARHLPTPAPAGGTPADVALLEEIRDLLSRR